MIQSLIDNHVPALRGIKIETVRLYETEDLIFNRPYLQFNPTWFQDEPANLQEPDGIEITFTSEKPISINALANLCNILCYGYHWAIDPEYGGLDNDEIPKEQDLDTCWHHTQITKVQDSYKFSYTIQQGFCTCS